MSDTSSRPMRKLMIARFPGNGWTHSDCEDWYAKTLVWAHRTPWIDLCCWKIQSTPVHMCRNNAVKTALEARADYLLMVDSDMAPDMESPGKPSAKPFVPTALDFMYKHDGPCIVAAPYCGAPPEERVMVFRESFQGSGPTGRAGFGDFPREEAAAMSGFVRLAGAGTGLLMIDLRAVAKLKPPYFRYEYRDEAETEWVSTEDIPFSRDLAFAGVPLYGAMDCWAGHHKDKFVGKPENPPIGAFPDRLIERVRTGIRAKIFEAADDAKKFPLQHVSIEAAKVMVAAARKYNVPDFSGLVDLSRQQWIEMGVGAGLADELTVAFTASGLARKEKDGVAA